MALVTGGCTGIGRAIARRLGSAGAQVAVNHPHTGELADAMVAQLRASGTDAAGFTANVSIRHEFVARVKAILDRWGQWDVLVAFGRLGTPGEIADVVTFLAGEGSGWITGQVVRVNGGTV